MICLCLALVTTIISTAEITHLHIQLECSLPVVGWQRVLAARDGRLTLIDPIAGSGVVTEGIDISE